MIEIAIKNLKTRIQTTSFKNNLQSKFVPLYKSRQNVISFKNKLEDNKINYPTQKINKQTILPKTTCFPKVFSSFGSRSEDISLNKMKKRQTNQIQNKKH